MSSAQSVDAAMTSDEQLVERLKKLIKAYQAFFRSIVLQGLPEIMERVLGPAAFSDEAEVVMRGAEIAAAQLLEAMSGMVEIPEGDLLDKLRLHEICHEVSKKLLGDPLYPMFKMRREGDRVVFEADRCPHGGEPTATNVGVYAGIIAGVIRALGAKAYPIRHPEAKKLIRDKGAYVVYPEEGACRIIVEKL